MEKLRKRRLTLGNVSISGPKYLIPRKILKTIHVTQTWEEVLQGIIGYKVTNMKFGLPLQKLYVIK